MKIKIDKVEKSYYCPYCDDSLCSKCVEFPWECPEKKRCTTCSAEMELVERLYVSYQQDNISLEDEV